MALDIPCSFNGPYKKEGKKDHWTVQTRKGYAGRLKGYCGKYREQGESRENVARFHGHMLRRVKYNEQVQGHYFVYNIHVDSDDHSFIANGVAVHNCLAHWVTCSKCGAELGDDDPNCAHLDREIMTSFHDENGIERIVSELCGRHLRDASGKLLRDASGNLVGDPESVKFIEASWVAKPAFLGAVLNHYISEIPKAAAQILDLSTASLEDTIEDIFKMRVADTNGMIVLRVAQHELLRRRQLSIADRVARSFI